MKSGEREFRVSNTAKSNGYHMVCVACGDTRLRPFEQIKGLCSTCKGISHFAALDVERDNDYVKYEMYRNPMDYKEFGFDFESVEADYQGDGE